MDTMALLMKALLIFLFFPLITFGGVVVNNPIGGSGGGGVSSTITNGLVSYAGNSSALISNANLTAPVITNGVLIMPNPNNGTGVVVNGGTFWMYRAETNQNVGVNFKTQSPWTNWPAWYAWAFDQSAPYDNIVLGSENISDMIAVQHDGKVKIGLGVTEIATNLGAQILSRLNVGLTGNQQSWENPVAFLAAGTNRFIWIADSNWALGNPQDTTNYAAIKFFRSGFWQIGQALDVLTGTNFGVRLGDTGANVLTITTDGSITVPGQITVTGTVVSVGLLNNTGSATISLITVGSSATLSAGMSFRPTNIYASTTFVTGDVASNTFFFGNANTGAQSNTFPASNLGGSLGTGKLICFAKTDNSGNQVMFDAGTVTRTFSTTGTRYLSLNTSNDCACYIYGRTNNTSGVFQQISGNLRPAKTPTNFAAGFASFTWPGRAGTAYVSGVVTSVVGGAGGIFLTNTTSGIGAIIPAANIAEQSFGSVSLQFNSGDSGFISNGVTGATSGAMVTGFSGVLE